MLFVAIAFGIASIAYLSWYHINETRKREAEDRKILEEAAKSGSDNLTRESPSDLAYMLEHKMITKKQHDAAIRSKVAQYPQQKIYEPAPVVQSTQSSSLLSDIADVAMIVNTVHHWNDHTPHRSNTDNAVDFPKEERSVGITTKESSWGFDDSDSRKSISSSMDTSSSWSSSSSSSSDFSSSDSGPSSDW